ncbi:prophage tail fiber N-terminal domain-containing protein [Pectobacterium carotovorum]|uniref:phage tail fiber protein n=1 Tax=Pectobacterium carotovorum TaxID=554 RepID=UPI003019AA33
MSVLISGVLMNPAGVPVSGAEVTFSALTNGPSVLNGFSASVMTDQDGNYAIPLEICEYAISIQSDGYNSVYGSVSINEKSTPATINELLKLAAMEQAVTPAIIVYFREIQTDVAAKLATMQTLGTNAAEAASAAATARDEAAQYAQNLSAAVAQAQQASAAAAASANAASNSANGALVAKNAAETAAGNAQATLANTMLKGQFGWGGRATNVGTSVNLFVFFTRDTPAGLYWVNQTGINRPPGFADCVLLWNPIEHTDFYGCLLAIGFTTGGAKTASVNVANGVWENQWTVDWNTRNLNPATTDTNQEIHALKTFMANWASLIIKPEGMGQPSYLQGNDFDGSTRWTCGYQDINANHLTLRNNKAGVAMTMHADRKIYASCDDLVLTDAKGFVRNARALEYTGGGEFGEFLKSQQSAGSAPVAGVWRAFVSVRHRGGNSNQEPGSDSTQWGWALVDNNMTQGNFNEFVLEKTFNGTWLNAVTLKHTGNTTVDANGFLKTASPIVKLFADGSSELNAESNGVVTTRLSEGVYHITGCLGLNADRAWGGEDGGIANPKCRNGYERIWNDYEVQEDGSLIIRTYHRVHSDAMPFAQNRLNLDHRPYNEKRDSEEWADRSPIDIPLGTYLTVRVQMPAREEDHYVPSSIRAVSHSNVYCNSVSPT